MSEGCRVYTAITWCMIAYEDVSILQLLTGPQRLMPLIHSSHVFTLVNLSSLERCHNMVSYAGVKLDSLSEGDLIVGLDPLI